MKKLTGTQLIQVLLVFKAILLLGALLYLAGVIDIGEKKSFASPFLNSHYNLVLESHS